MKVENSKNFSLSDIKNLLVKELPKNLKDVEAKSRGVLTVIPLVGGLLEKLLFHNRDKQEIKQLAIYILDVEKEIYRLGESKIDKDYLNTEEFYCLFKKILDKVRFQSREYKIKFFRNFLLNSIRKDTKKINFNYILDKVDLLELEHFEVLEWYKNNGYNTPNMVGSNYDSMKHGDLGKISEFYIDLENDLSVVGFLSLIQRERYFLTKSGKDFLDYIYHDEE